MQYDKPGEVHVNTPRPVPHFVIEFNDINEVPDIYIDGTKVVGDGIEDSGLQSLKLEWKTNTASEGRKTFEMSTIELNTKMKVKRSANNYISERVETEDLD